MDHPSRRSAVYATRAMVACSQPLAAEAGHGVLRRGGNAVDAVVAMAACLNVTEPCSTGIGGDAFLLFYDAATRRVRGLNGSGRSPASLTLERARADASMPDKDGMVPTHVHCVTVPGAAALWADAVETLGTMKLAAVLEPAIRLAEHGFPVSAIAADMWQVEEQRLLASSPHGGDMLVNGATAPRAGQIMRMPKLAQTFRTLAEQGKDGFYRGRIAQAIVEAVKSKGGCMEFADLAAHKTDEVEPIAVDYDGRLRVYEVPPNGQGITALMALKILEHCPHFQHVQHNSPEYLHLLIEALRLAFADTRHFVADPSVVPVPTEQLLSDEYLKARAALITPDRALVALQHGQLPAAGDTVYFCVVDEMGNACSFINSNYMGFGSAIVPDGCGFSLQNRGANFSLRPGHANALAPSKRPYHTIIPAMVTTTDGELIMPFGVMGSWMQPQGHVQVFLNMFRFGMNPQQALDAPRLCISPGAADGDIHLEEGLEHVVERLHEMGHPVYLIEPKYDAPTDAGAVRHTPTKTIKVVRGWHARALFGRGQVILQTHDGNTGQRVLCGGSDPRGDGLAFGY